MAKKPETQFRTGVVAPFLKTLKNTVVFPIQQMTIRGTPDYLLCILGHFVALELKSKEGKTDPLQQFTLQQVERVGGTCFVANPENWKHVRHHLEQLDTGEENDSATVWSDF